MHDQGSSVTEAAKSFGVASNLLYHWIEQKEPLSTGSRRAENEPVELKRRRKKNNVLRMEKEMK